MDKEKNNYYVSWKGGSARWDDEFSIHLPATLLLGENPVWAIRQDFQESINKQNAAKAEESLRYAERQKIAKRALYDELRKEFEAEEDASGSIPDDGNRGQQQ